MALGRKKSRVDLVRERASDLSDRASDLAGQAAKTVAPRIDDAREFAGNAVTAAGAKVRDDYVPLVRDEVLPRVRDEYLPKVRDEYLPKGADYVGKVTSDVKGYVPKARDAAVPVVAKAMRRTPLADYAPEPPKRRRRWVSLLALVGLAGAAAYVYQRFVVGGDSSSPAGSGQEPTPPVPSTATTTSVPSDVAGAPVSDESPVRPDPMPSAQTPGSEEAAPVSAPTHKADS